MNKDEKGNDGERKKDAKLKYRVRKERSKQTSKEGKRKSQSRTDMKKGYMKKEANKEGKH